MGNNHIQTSASKGANSSDSQRAQLKGDSAPMDSEDTRINMPPATSTKRATTSPATTTTRATSAASSTSSTSQSSGSMSLSSLSSFSSPSVHAVETYDTLPEDIHLVYSELRSADTNYVVKFHNLSNVVIKVVRVFNVPKGLSLKQALKNGNYIKDNGYDLDAPGFRIVTGPADVIIQPTRCEQDNIAITKDAEGKNYWIRNSP